MFGVGDRVRCVNDAKPKDFKPQHYPNWVKEGEEYHIREIFDNDNIVVGVLLEELANPIYFIPLIGRAQENAFATWRFEIEQTAYAIEEEKEAEKITEEILKELEL